MPLEPFSIRIDTVRPTLLVFERADRGGKLYIAWTEGRSRRQARLTGLETVRNADGTLNPTLVERAIARALRQQGAAIRSRDTQVARPESMPVPPLPPPAPISSGLTLGEALSQALVPGTGLYATKTPQWHDMIREAGRIKRILGADRPLDGLAVDVYIELWRGLAELRVDTGEGGPRAAERAVALLRRVLGWLAEHGRIRTFPLPPTRWKQKLAEDWMQTLRVHRPDQALPILPSGEQGPSYGPAEIKLIFEHLEDVDARFRILLELGAECRGGQVIRCFRSHLRLEATAAEPHGTLSVPGGGHRKPGGVIVLDAHQREALDQALSGEGVLGPLEVAHKTGAITDYPLFPANRLVRGQVPVRAGIKPLHRRTLNDWLRQLETSLGIPHVTGRGMHGLRRGLATAAEDLVESHEIHEGVANALGGWKGSSSVRARRYVKERPEKARSQAAQVRQRIRHPQLPTPAPEAAPSDPSE